SLRVKAAKGDVKQRPTSNAWRRITGLLSWLHGWRSWRQNCGVRVAKDNPFASLHRGRRQKEEIALAYPTLARAHFPSFRVITNCMTIRSLSSAPLVYCRWTIRLPPSSSFVTVREERLSFASPRDAPYSTICSPSNLSLLLRNDIRVARESVHTLVKAPDDV